MLVFKIDEFLALKNLPTNLLTCAQAIKGKLLTNSPNPKTGYRRDATVGATKDLSTPEQIVKRHAILKQSKVDFTTVLVKAKVVNPATKSAPPAAEKPWWLAVAPVAAPGNSQHGTGYALDISGDNTETTRLARRWGPRSFSTRPRMCMWNGRTG